MVPIKNKFFVAVIADILFEDLKSDGLKDELKALYELEYKYHKLKDQAPAKVMTIIDKKARDIGSEVASKLGAVYENWLISHSVIDPQKWAERRFADIKVGKEVKGLWDDMKEYKPDDFVGPKYSPTLFKVLKKDYHGGYEVTKEFGGLKKLLEEIKAKDFDTFYKIAIEFYKNWVFPAWEERWGGENLKRTQQRLEKVFEALKKASSGSLSNMFLVINRALNETHQTGDMLDYIEAGYGIDREFLDKLSQQKTRKWDKEIEPLTGVTAAVWSDFVKGEWWIDSNGQAQYCDNQVVDMGHEGYAMQGFFGEILDELGFDDVEEAVSAYYSGDIDEEKLNELFGHEKWKEIKDDVRLAYSKYHNAILVINLNFAAYKFTDGSLETIQDFIIEEANQDDDTGIEGNVLLEEFSTKRWKEIPINDFLAMKKMKEVWKY